MNTTASTRATTPRAGEGQAGALEGRMRAEHATLSRHNDVAEAIDYMLNRWLALARFLVDGTIRLSNNAAEPALREIATIAVAGCSPGPAVVMSEPP